MFPPLNRYFIWILYYMTGHYMMHNRNPAGRHTRRIQNTKDPESTRLFKFKHKQWQKRKQEKLIVARSQNTHLHKQFIVWWGWLGLNTKGSKHFHNYKTGCLYSWLITYRFLSCFFRWKVHTGLVNRSLWSSSLVRLISSYYIMHCDLTGS